MKVFPMARSDDREGFARRLNEALDQIDFPSKGRGRQVELGKRMGVSQRSAGMWLEGTTMPTLKRVHALAELIRRSPDWLLTGRDPNRLTAGQQAQSYYDWLGIDPKSTTAQIVQALVHLPEQDQREVLGIVREMVTERRRALERLDVLEAS